MDSREVNHQWYERFDAARMLIILMVDAVAGMFYCEPCEHQFSMAHEHETAPCPLCGADAGEAGYVELELPAKYEVCETCDGKGHHVNPSIDCHGLTREDFDDDPDFAEDYMRGVYDVPCNECHGQRVVPVLDESRCTPEQKQAAYDAMDARHQANVEEADARRYGY